MTRFATVAVMLATASMSLAQSPTTVPADVLKSAETGDVETTRPLPSGDTPDGAPATGLRDEDHATRATGNIVFRVGQPGAEMEKCAFMGVSTSPLQPAARAQVDVPNGIGLVVDFVEAESPAAKAGVQQDDVIHKLDDQLIINPQQLSVLVRTHKAGDTITLTVLRKNKPETIKVTLAEKMLPPVEAMTPVQFGLPHMNALRVNPALPDGAKLEPQFDLPPEILQRLQAGPGARDMRMMTSSDGTHTISITVRDDKKSATIKDKDGKVLFDGPLDTEADRDKVPAELREKLEKLEASSAPAEAPEAPADVAPLPGSQPR